MIHPPPTFLFLLRFDVPRDGGLLYSGEIPWERVFFCSVTGINGVSGHAPIQGDTLQKCNRYDLGGGAKSDEVPMTNGPTKSFPSTNDGFSFVSCLFLSLRWTILERATLNSVRASRIYIADSSDRAARTFRYAR